MKNHFIGAKTCYKFNKQNQFIKAKYMLQSLKVKYFHYRSCYKFKKQNHFIKAKSCYKLNK